ncbi:MAG: hypothetical protein COX19_04815 [Desulfobacterales bacterium CG23_combo_of_CG06-09_8_20_14_all_51_8]|nr:MAG: hypothetical protein COX19_04815 [Desulfobacterales bacterium CG23_combo_of_CG06-09_8_20_14_all_51_8]
MTKNVTKNQILSGFFMVVDQNCVPVRDIHFYFIEYTRKKYNRLFYDFGTPVAYYNCKSSFKMF